MRILEYFLILWIFHIAHIRGETYEMKISFIVLERRFFESNDDRNKCQLNMKVYGLIVRNQTHSYRPKS